MDEVGRKRKGDAERHTTRDTKIGKDNQSISHNQIDREKQGEKEKWRKRDRER